ncbi:hypothetical protein COCOBI_10-4710 [Coccomyxa sp. Obi]|nr:hypothetical protein COCOBI_10-4710 [Coccomyxa sp. Obi]
MLHMHMPKELHSCECLVLLAQIRWPSLLCMSCMVKRVSAWAPRTAPRSALHLSFRCRKMGPFPADETTR